MKLELKNIKHSEFASEETHCYQGTLYVDGKRTALVSNDGHGGGDHQNSINGDKWEDTLKKLEPYAKAKVDSYTDASAEDKADLIRSACMFLRNQGDAAIPSNIHEEIYQGTTDGIIRQYGWVIDAVKDCGMLPWFMDLESDCSGLVSDWLISKDIKADLRKSCVFTCDEKDGIRVLGYKGGIKAMKKFGDSKLRESILKRYTNVVFIADLKPEEQRKLYLAA